MATLSHADSSRMYSWWWDSHISPKNSKWLQENLTDMDVKVKAMIKLIEEDADSFARRAEMYYKKRPELMKLVEEFYRAYRALAERYDHATGVIRQAHRTMAEVFPNQVPLVLADDSPASSASEMDPCTPETTPPTRALFDPDSSQKDSLRFSLSHSRAVRRNGAYSEGRVRKGLDFHEAEENERSMQGKESHVTHNQSLSEPEVLGKFGKEIENLKDALAKLEAEKDAGLAQYQQSLERLSKLESEVSRAQEDFRGLNERANKAEGEVQTLWEALTILEAEKEASLLQYQQCLARIANLESVVSHAKEDVGELNERADKAEMEAQALKQEVAAIEYEKDAALDQYHQSLEMISTLENKLLLAEENARKLIERANKADREVENLKQALAKLTGEKEAAALQYQQCLETISSLEHEIISVREEARRLNGEIDSGVAKLNGAEEQCVLLKRSNQSLHTELESLALKMGSQSEELKEKQVEVGTLWACIQEERLRFMEAETAFQTLQHLHFQTQEELRSFASELQNRAQLLRDIETRNQSLQDNILKIKEKNKSLNELNISSSMSIKDMQNEIFSLRETKGKLEEEAELRVDQRKALQQEIYFMKEELNEMNKKHQAMLDQVDAVGYSPECFESSVKELQDENSNLKETCKREISEKVLLLEKSEMTEHLLEKNALLEKLLSDLSSELEGARGKINALEESFQSLLGEKFTFVTEKASLITQLLVTTENLEKLSEKNTFLEISLSDAHDELEGLKARSKSLEDSCQLLENEKFDIINEKDTLVSLGEITRQRLEVLEKRYRELEWKYSALEKDKYQEVNIKNEQYSLLQIEANNLFEMNEELQLKLRDRDQKEEVLATTIENLHGKLFDMQKENISVLDETFTLSNLSLIFENVINEKSVELKELVEDMDKLHGVNGALEDKLSIMGWKLEGVQLENLHLKESLKNSEDELRTVTCFSDQLNCEIVNGKDLLSQKEIELYEAVCKLTATENEKSRLQEIVENLKREIDEVMMVRADQKMQILKLHEDNDYLSQKNGCLSETNRELEVGLHKLHEEHVKTKSMKNMWEGEATNFFGELQISAVFQALLGEKIHELAEACKSLEDGITSKDMHIKLLKEKISTLEGENGLLKAQLAAYLPAIISLKNNISSLEKRTCLRAKHKKSHSGRAKDLTLASPQNVESCKEVNADHMVPDALSELQDLQNRIKAVEKAVVKRERLATQENLNANIKLEAAMKLTEELKFKCGSNQENVRPALEISEPENGLLMMKDIMLDQVSECSSSYEISRRQRVKAESTVLESWDTADVGGSIDLTVGKGKKIITEPMKRQKSKRLNSDILVEKELGVDTLEIARTFSQSRREMSKSKTLERLNSDVQKLTNLQITVQDLKRKVEITEKSKKVKTMVECDALKGQLDEAEEAILKYFELNGKLKKSVEGRSFSTDSKSATESEETGNVKRRISDRARRVSEKIGRLQLEVQKIQLVLLKLDDENEKESKRRTRITETKRRVVLRDYLYGGVRSSPRRRKPVFCGCIQPPTRGD